MLTEILPSLVQRPEDFLNNAEERVSIYKDILLQFLEVRKRNKGRYHMIFSLKLLEIADECARPIDLGTVLLGMQFCT